MFGNKFTNRLDRLDFAKIVVINLEPIYDKTKMQRVIIEPSISYIALPLQLVH